MDNTSPLESAYAALAAHDKACRALFAELDHQVCMAGPETLALWTSVLYALDAARVTAASMLAYLPEPGPTQDQPTRPPCDEAGCQAEANYHYGEGNYCWQHIPGGPDYKQATQDQEPTLQEQYNNGFLTVAEHDRLVAEQTTVETAHNAEPAPAFSDAGTLAFYSRKLDVGA